MPFQRVRALVNVRHDGVLRIPGITSGENGQDFVVPDDQATRLIGLGLVSSVGVAEPPATGLEQVFVGADGLLRRSGGAVVGGRNGAVENGYTKALFFGQPLSQAGSVKGFSQSAVDAVYCGGTTDAEVVSTEAGYLTCLGGAAPNNKGLSIAAAQTQWKLQDGESLFLQVRLKKDTLPTGGAEHFIGNSSGGPLQGLLLSMTPGGAIQPYIKVGSLGIALLGGSSTTLAVANTPLNITIWIDGATKIMNGWVNGVLQPNWTNKPVAPDGTSYQTSSSTTPGVWCLGNGGDTVSPSVRTMNAFKFGTARIVVIEPGKTLQNAPLLDWLFNRDPFRLLRDSDVSLV